MEKSNLQIELECFYNWRLNFSTLRPTPRNVRRMVMVCRHIYWLESQLGVAHA